jgi:hypothetical protein
MPFYWLRGDAAVILSVVHGSRPSHQYYPEVSHSVWKLLEGCWDGCPARRPSMSSLCVSFERD